MGIIIFAIVLIAIFWVAGVVSTALAYLFAIPLFFVMSLPALRRRSDLVAYRLWAWSDGYGPPYTRKNSARAYRTYANMRNCVGELRHWEADKAWALEKLKQFE